MLELCCWIGFLIVSSLDFKMGYNAADSDILSGWLQMSIFNVTNQHLQNVDLLLKSLD